MNQMNYENKPNYSNYNDKAQTKEYQNNYSKNYGNRERGDYRPRENKDQSEYKEHREHKEPREYRENRDYHSNYQKQNYDKHYQRNREDYQNYQPNKYHQQACNNKNFNKYENDNDNFTDDFDNRKNFNQNSRGGKSYYKPKQEYPREVFDDEQEWREKFKEADKFFSQEYGSNFSKPSYSYYKEIGNEKRNTKNEYGTESAYNYNNKAYYY